MADKLLDWICGINDYPAVAIDMASAIKVTTATAAEYFMQNAEVNRSGLSRCPPKTTAAMNAASINIDA